MANSGYVGTPRRLALALAVSLTTVAVNAEPVDVIYSAENALYGAGYDIGIADGWMDDQLRSAIRQYQSSRNDLQPTGNLDINTLFSLGIAAENGAPVTGNQVANRQAALDALGLSPSDLPSGGSSSSVASAPAPEPAPQPTPEPEPEPETIAEPAQPEEPATAQQTQPPATTEPLATSQPANSEDTGNETAESPAPAESTAEVEPDMAEPEPEASPEPTRVVASEPASEDQPSATAESIPEQSDQSNGQGSDDQPGEEPAQMAAQNESTDSTGESDQDTSSGGFFSWLYDFFFGWMF